MRVTSMVAGLAIVLAACGGEKKTENQSTTATPEQPAAAPAAEPAAGGASHDVNMVLDGTTPKFDPAELTIKAGDKVNFHNKSGGPHNVSFWADSVPAGGAEVLKKAMGPDQIAPLEGPMTQEQDQVYTVSFAGAPTGDYKFYCLPHIALGMRGKISVQ